jgi:hypothetical protein
MAELADALDLGSNAQKACRFKSCSRHQSLSLFTADFLRFPDAKEGTGLLAPFCNVWNPLRSLISHGSFCRPGQASR